MTKKNKENKKKNGSNVTRKPGKSPQSSSRPNSARPGLGAQSRSNAYFATNVRQRFNAPRVDRVGNELVRVVHSELIGSLASGSLDGSTTGFLVNAGLSLFPWLSPVANQYNRYRFTKLVFRYVPTGAVVTTAGVLTMGYNPDPKDPLPPTRSALVSLQGSVVGRLYEPLRIMIPPRLLTRTTEWHLCRTGATTPEALNLYDVCMLITNISGAPLNFSFGDLYVDYVVEFMQPIAPQLPLSTSNPKRLKDKESIGITNQVVTSMNINDNEIKPLALTRTSGNASVAIDSFGWIRLVPGLYEFVAQGAVDMMSTIVSKDMYLGPVYSEIGGSSLGQFFSGLDATLSHVYALASELTTRAVSSRGFFTIPSDLDDLYVGLGIRNTSGHALTTGDWHVDPRGVTFDIIRHFLPVQKTILA